MKILKGWVSSLVLLGYLLGGYNANAFTFFVTQTNDSTKVTSLRGAVIAANRWGGYNTIVLQPKTYQLSIPAAIGDDARTGDLNVTQGYLAIVVAGKGMATIHAFRLSDLEMWGDYAGPPGLRRVFRVSPQAYLTLVNIKITGGTSNSPTSSEFGALVDEFIVKGGAIYNAGHLTMKDCVISGNTGGDGGFNDLKSLPGGDGGGLYNIGTATLSRCIIADNRGGLGSYGYYNSTSGGGNGGGIFNSGTMTLDHCLLRGNSGGAGRDGSSDSGWGRIFAPIGPGGAGGKGGAIFNSGKLTINFSTLVGNFGGEGGVGGFGGAGNGGAGGGIFNSGILFLNTCTLSANHAGDGGDGQHANNPYADMGAGGRGGNGGAIYNRGSLNSTGSTIVLNQAGAGGNGSFIELGNTNVVAPPGGDGGNGGGIYNETNSVILRNTLLALNSSNLGGAGGWSGISGPAGKDGLNPDVSGNFTSHSFNLIGVSDGSTGLTNSPAFTHSVTTDIVGNSAAPIDPLIGPLQMNGGLTPTHALLPGSRAIDGAKSSGQTTDQRGHPRPHYYYSAFPTWYNGDGTDIGAFELDD